MPFNNTLPEWNKTATAPTQTKKDAGWSAGEHPPASIFDWFFNTTYKALQELQAEAINTDQKGVNNGVATLDATGDLPIGQADNILDWVKGFGLGSVSKALSNPDLNTQTTNGLYYCSGTITNGPQAANGFLMVEAASATVVKQTYLVYSTNAMYYRLNSSGTWGVWVQIATYDSNGKVAIANLPDATTTTKGIAQLNDTYTSTSTTQAATANALKKLTDVVQMTKLFQDSGTLLTSSSLDLNATFATGFYYYAGGNVNHTNGPTQQNGVVEVYQYSASTALQVFSLMNTVTPKRWIRYCSGGTWGDWIQNAQYDSAGKIPIANLPIVTTSTNGILTSTDKSKLDGIAANANNYSHPTGDGNSHVPATGTTNNTKVLKAGSTANSAAWGVVNGSEVVEDTTHRFVTDTEKTTWNGKASTSTATTGANGLMSSTDKTKLDGIATGAEVNQNAFSTVQVNGTNVVADIKTDTLFVNSGTGIALTPDAALDSITVSVETPTPLTLTLNNGTTVFSDRTPMYTKDGYSVELRGAVIATGGGITIATLPAGFRPPKTEIFKVAQNWSTSNDGATIYINSDGTVVLQVAANYAQSISFAGIRFSTI